MKGARSAPLVAKIFDGRPMVAQKIEVMSALRAPFNALRPPPRGGGGGDRYATAFRL